MDNIQTIKKKLILNQSAQFVKGVGPQRIKTLAKLNIHTVKDLLFYFPRRYEDRSNFKPINKVIIGQVETVRGRVLTSSLRRIKGNRTIFTLALGDESGVIYAIWFNQPYMKNVFAVDDDVILYGKVDHYGKIQINSPEYEILKPDEDHDPVHTGRVVPIYPLKMDIGQRYLRKVIKYSIDHYLDNVLEFIPQEIVKRNSFLELKQALLNIHFPDNFDQLAAARRRLIFDEFFLLQLALGLKRKALKETKKAIKFKLKAELIEQFKKSLPFELTSAQKNVINEIEADMGKKQPMNRLLQGDVGSGKTIVSIWAIVVCVQSGYQAALMVPTEILAMQHYETLNKILSPLGIKVTMLTSGLKKKEKEKVIQDICEHKFSVIVGTHSLIQGDIKFKKLGLIIVDEQHKFGVMQRVKLQQKANMPDMLVMSATPIPRTLAITVYGDLDISTIRELPPGRTPVETYWISEKKRQDLYIFLKKKIKDKNQIYVVYPLVEKSKSIDLKAATKMYEHFRDDIFAENRVGLLHGRMKDLEKNQVMQLFKAGDLDILVATTVIEVGIDVPNASVILIEHAERFGLSQLHQLRGRVGRGKKQAYCVLLSEGKSEDSVKRLSAMTKTTDGFKIAEYDLLIRGPGEFFGTRQHGLPELKIANIITDTQQLIVARKEATEFLEQFFSEINDSNSLIAQELAEKFPKTGDSLLAR
ncbi:MAG: ATP-dependent DNA helicase RecG [Candidatus Omnitrophica bacterium]|nr:ATP-dependent DNA helicase RecG [Candidatus Omnitrophota bacterium]